MWAALRLVRATFRLAVILSSYLWQLGLRKVFGRERAWVQRRWDRVHERNAKRLYRGCVSLRGVFIKMGQVLSIMGTFLPRCYGRELEKLQDNVPPHPFRHIAKSFTSAFGVHPDDAFASFSHEPIAAASLAQVHEATTHEGDRVAVKLLYPNVATVVRVDMRVIGWGLKVYKWFVPIGQLDRFLEQLRDMLERETDCLNEARCCERMAANFVDEPDMLFPAIYHDLTSKSVLTMSFMDGVKISDKDALRDLGLDPTDVARRLVQGFFKQVFADRFFHADPHPGNFFVQRGPEGEPRIVLLDFGAASDVRDNLAEGMLKVLGGYMAKNDVQVVEGIERMGFVNANGDRALFEETIKSYFAKLLSLDIRDLSNVDYEKAMELADPGLKRAELRRLMRAIEYPMGWFYVERAALIMFGLTAHLAPRLNAVQVGFPYLMRFMAEEARRARALAAAEGESATNAMAESSARPS